MGQAEGRNARRRPDPNSVRMRAAGGGLAAMMTGSGAIAGFLGGGRAGAPLLDGALAGWLFFLGTYGLPVSAVVGSWLGPRAAGASLGAVPGLAVRAAIASVVLGAVEVSALSALHDVLTGVQPITSLPWLFGFLPVIGILVLGVPALILVMPATLAWTVLMRIVAAGLAAPDS